MIEVSGLTKYYGERAAVDNVTFSAGTGEIVGFLGPNGAGKTTTMRMLTCFLPPTSGTASVAGFDILDASMDVRRRIGYLPESVPLYRDLTVRTYLDFVSTLKGMPRAERRERADVVMEECGVTEVCERPIGKLSRGYRQRVGLAQALINDPEVLILDEPTVGLDPRQIVEIRELIRSLAGERTVVLSTHILPEVSLICQRVLIINQGRLVTDDTPENLGRNLSGKEFIEVRVSGNEETAIAAIKPIDGVQTVGVSRDPQFGTNIITVECLPGVDPRQDIAREIVSSGIGLLEMSRRAMSLEDIFVHLVTEEAHDV